MSTLMTKVFIWPSGAYSDSHGIPGIRKEVADFIHKHDGYEVEFFTAENFTSLERTKNFIRAVDHFISNASMLYLLQWSRTHLPDRRCQQRCDANTEHHHQKREGWGMSVLQKHVSFHISMWCYFYWRVKTNFVDKSSVADLGPCSSIPTLFCFHFPLWWFSGPVLLGRRG